MLCIYYFTINDCCLKKLYLYDITEFVNSIQHTSILTKSSFVFLIM